MAKKRSKKHNKKRNTAFLFEVLVREMAKCVVNKDKARRQLVIDILKEHFKKGTLLYKEMELYRVLNEAASLRNEVAEKLLTEAKKARDEIDSNKLFAEQGKLISRINKSLSPDVFNNFVPNYKSLASIAQIFNKATPVKERVLLESVVVERLSSSPEEKEEDKLQSIDNLTYKTFVKKFNEQYGENILNEQKELLTRYVMSFADNGMALKIFLNEELGRLKNEVRVLSETEDIKGDKEMVEKANQVFSIVEGFSKEPVNDEMIKKVLKVQNLVSEARKDGN